MLLETVSRSTVLNKAMGEGPHGPHSRRGTHSFPDTCRRPSPSGTRLGCVGPVTRQEDLGQGTAQDEAPCPSPAHRPNTNVLTWQCP